MLTGVTSGSWGCPWLLNRTLRRGAQVIGASPSAGTWLFSVRSAEVGAPVSKDTPPAAGTGTVSRTPETTPTESLGLDPDSMPSSRACLTTASQAPIDLPEQVLIMIVSRVRDVRPATAEEDACSKRWESQPATDARSLYADVMHGIGSVSRRWRKLAKGVLMGDELAVQPRRRSACLASRARCRSVSWATPGRGTSGRCWDRGR